jgi:sugar-specific transcriptional regulator TrmB
MNNGERIETLMELGFTLNQARAYLALALSGPAGAKELAEASSITRQDVYRVMGTLEEKGLAEKLLSTPTVYKALPIEQVIKGLLARKVGEHRDLQRRTRRLVVDVQSKHSSKTVQDEESQFVIIPSKEAIIQRLAEALSKTSRSLEVVTSSERFSSAILAFSRVYESAIQRGVRIRIASEDHVAQNGALEVARNLAKSQSFEVRFFSNAPEAVVSIFDSKEASVTISKTANSSKARALWSNDNGFVTLARHYFENMWNNSVKLAE